MNIVSAGFLDADHGTALVTTDDGAVWNVPVNGTGSWPDRLRDWVADGGVIDPYIPPPPPTDEDRIDAVFPQTDSARVIFEAFFELTNRLIALEGGNAITKAQLRNWFKAKLNV